MTKYLSAGVFVPSGVYVLCVLFGEVVAAGAFMKGSDALRQTGKMKMTKNGPISKQPFLTTTDTN